MIQKMSKHSEDLDTKGLQDSPSNVKMKYLTEKLSLLSLGSESESQVRSDSFTNRIRQLEDKVSKLQITEESKLNVITNLVIKRPYVKN